MRSARRAFAGAMNPYRIPPVAIRTRISRFFRTRSLARFAVVLLGTGAFAAGYAHGRTPAGPPLVITTPTVCPAAPEPAVAATTETTESDTSEAVEEPRRVYAITPAQAKATIAARARDALRALGRRDLRALAALVDADEGLRYGELDTNESAVLSRAELARCLEDPNERAWGEDYIHPVTCAALWKEHVLDADFARASHVDYNVPSVDWRPASLQKEGDDHHEDPTLEAYGDAIVVQVVVRRPSLDGTGEEPRRKVWSTLRLVFQPRGEEWRLAGLFWSDWWT